MSVLGPKTQKQNRESCVRPIEGTFFSRQSARHFFNSVLHGLTEHVFVFDFFVQKLNFYICFVLQKVTTETRIFVARFCGPCVHPLSRRD